MRQPIELALGSKRYKLIFDKAAIYAFEDENLKRLGHERGIFQFIADTGKMLADVTGRTPTAECRGPSFTEVALALWAAARTHQPRLVFDKLRGELEPGDYMRYIELLILAFNAAMPERPASEEEAPAAEDAIPLSPTPNSGG